MRRVFVVGATGGLGRAVGAAFGRRHAKLLLLGRDIGELEGMVMALNSAGVSAHATFADTSDEGCLIDALNGGREVLGGIDVLVNCSGWSPQLAPLVSTSTADWERAMVANARPSFLLMRWALQAMAVVGQGDIVDVCTAVVDVSAQGVVAYRASKAAQLSVGSVARAEAKGSGVRVVTVLPEPMDTPMRWTVTPDYSREAVLAVDAVAEAICTLTELPRGVAVDEVFLRVP